MYLKVINAPVTIIQKAIQRGGCPREVFDWALALAQFEGALVEAGRVTAGSGQC